MQVGGRVLSLVAHRKLGVLLGLFVSRGPTLKQAATVCAIRPNPPTTSTLPLCADLPLAWGLNNRIHSRWLLRVLLHVQVWCSSGRQRW